MVINLNKKIQQEGKTVNNKPYFLKLDRDFDEDDAPVYIASDALPGEYAYEIDDYEGNDEILKQLEKHNQRARDNYDKNGLLWGSKEQQDALYNKAKKERETNANPLGIDKKPLKRSYPIPDSYNGAFDWSEFELKESKDMKHNVKRINESQLKAIITEAVRRVLKEQQNLIVKIYDGNGGSKNLELKSEDECAIYQYICDHWQDFMNTKVLRAYKTYYDYIKEMAKQSIEDEYIHIPRYFDRFWILYAENNPTKPQQRNIFDKLFQSKLNFELDTLINMMEQ